MTNIKTLFAGLDGTGNHRENDQEINDGSETHIAKIAALYNAGGAEKA